MTYYDPGGYLFFKKLTKLILINMSAKKSDTVEKTKISHSPVKVGDLKAVSLEESSPKAQSKDIYFSVNA